MPLSLGRLDDNLARLCDNLETDARSWGLAAAISGPAATLSEELFLAHSTADATFAKICQSGSLRSAARLEADGLRRLRPDCAEAILGTQDAVFFFVAPFRYPSTGCGLLFSRTLEVEAGSKGASTPFDSGSLISKVQRPDPSEPVLDFFRRHELPTPAHRRHLGMSMSWLFDQPRDYVEGLEPQRPHPMGLTGGDQRRWTHEVRIPHRVGIHGSHLEAVFAPAARIGQDPAIEALFDWCMREGVQRIILDTPRENDFEALKRECLDYIRRRLY